MTRRTIRVAAIWLALGSCMPIEEPNLQPVPEPVPETLQPPIRIGLTTSAAEVEISGPTGLALIDPDEGVLEQLDPGETVTVVARDDRVALTGRSATRSRRLLRVESPSADGFVVIDGRPYRGAVELDRGADGVRIVNVIGLEDYLVGVVSAELGARRPEELAAAMAQAVVARTYALRNRGRWEADGFDLLAGVASQVYRGAGAEDSVSRAAVEATAGEVLMYGNDLIDAFYSSTCGGHTEAGSAVFAGADRPYLQARPDLDPNGRAWCAISPRFRWSRRWTGRELESVLRRTLAAEGLSTARAKDLREVRVLSRTPAGHIASLELVGLQGRTTVRGAAIRRVLSPPAGGILESTDFTVRIGRTGGRIERLEVDGQGFGHGVGLCQWGAIGRARAGQGYGEILLSYFPGTELRRIY